MSATESTGRVRLRDGGCSRCGKMRDGNHKTYCVACDAAYRAAYYDANKEAYLAKRKEGRDAKREGRPPPQRKPSAVSITCTVCPSNRDAGCSAYCRPCFNAKKGEYRASRRAEIKAASKAKIATASDDRLQELKVAAQIRFARWNAKNPGRKLVLYKKWRAANRASAIASQKRWNAANPLSRIASSANRRARILNAGGQYAAKDIHRISEAQKMKCACGCGLSIKKKRHVDHIMPLSRGGSNFPSNLQLLSPACNQRKNAKDPIDWARELGKLL